MFALMTHCIYCLAPLPEERSGVGEHIIPESIYGFWRSYDVCRQCMDHFGQHVDGLAASCPAIVRAMERLDLPEAERFARNLPYEGTDRLTNTSIPYILKHAGFMPKVVQQEDDLFNCPEGRWKELAVPFLRAATRGRVGDKEFDAEMERLPVLYDELPEGGAVESEILGYTIRKGAIGNITVNTDNVASVTPLIAKIAVAFVWLILPPHELAQLCDVVQLVDHARHGGSIRPFLINWCPLKQADAYAPFHRMRAYFSKASILIDITLFGYSNWRVLIPVKNAGICAHDPQGRPLDGVEFILDFTSPGRREQFVGIQPTQSGKLEYYVVTH
jgi:HNH endonuclease